MRRGQGPEFASGNTGQVVNEHLRSSRQQCAAFERPSECAAVPGATEPAQALAPVKSYSKLRSNPQCRYLNGVALLLGDATGYETRHISEVSVRDVFRWRDKVLPGKRVVGKSRCAQRRRMQTTKNDRC